MNQRIRELAEQAGIDFFNSIDPEFSGREYCEAWTEQQQKFAELIVRECMTVCESATQEGQPLHLVSLGYSQRLKEHFGVKE